MPGPASSPCARTRRALIVGERGSRIGSVPSRFGQDGPEAPSGVGTEGRLALQLGQEIAAGDRLPLARPAAMGDAEQGAPARPTVGLRRRQPDNCLQAVPGGGKVRGKERRHDGGVRGADARVPVDAWREPFPPGGKVDVRDDRIRAVEEGEQRDRSHPLPRGGAGRVEDGRLKGNLGGSPVVGLELGKVLDGAERGRARLGQEEVAGGAGRQDGRLQGELVDAVAGGDGRGAGGVRKSRRQEGDGRSGTTRSKASGSS